MEIGLPFISLRINVAKAVSQDRLAVKSQSSSPMSRSTEIEGTRVTIRNRCVLYLPLSLDFASGSSSNKHNIESTEATHRGLA